MSPQNVLRNRKTRPSCLLSRFGLLPKPFTPHSLCPRALDSLHTTDFIVCKGFLFSKRARQQRGMLLDLYLAQRPLHLQFKHARDTTATMGRHRLNTYIGRTLRLRPRAICRVFRYNLLKSITQRLIALATFSGLVDCTVRCSGQRKIHDIYTNQRLLKQVSQNLLYPCLMRRTQI
jgi:hypothetical protein